MVCELQYLIIFLQISFVYCSFQMNLFVLLFVITSIYIYIYIYIVHVYIFTQK